MRFQILLPAGLAVAAVLALACTVDPTPPGVDLTHSAKSHLTGCSQSVKAPGNDANSDPDKADGEGEIFGSIYQDGSRLCLTLGDSVIKLVPSGFSLPNYDSILSPTSDYRLMWEFWDHLASDGPCVSGTHGETSHSEDGGYEKHCVNSGTGQTFIFTGPKRGGGTRSFAVDYLSVASGTVYDTLHGDFGGSFYVVGSPSGGSEVDLPINTDLGTTTYTETPILRVDAALSPTSAYFSPTTAPSADTSYTFRMDTHSSTSNWTSGGDPMSNRGSFLVRLYYREGGGSWSALTNYFDPWGGGEAKLLQTHKFAGPTSCPGSPRSYTIGMEMLRPDEVPANTPSTADSAQVTISVTCPLTVTAPSSLSAGNLGMTGATIHWTNGTTTTGTTTAVQVMPSGGGWTTVDGSLATGVDSVVATGLTPATSYSVQVRHTLSGVNSSWTSSTGLFTTSSVPAPSSLSSSSVTSTTATVSWTNGTSVTGTTTDVQIKPSGGSYATYGSPLSAGTSSVGLTGLTPNTTYSVQVRHTLAGVSSGWTTAASLFTTEIASLSITGFTAGSCDRFFSGGKWRVTYDLAWTISGSASGLTWQVLESTSDTTSGSIVASGSSGLTATNPSYPEISDPTYMNYWVRYSGLTGWYPLSDNALRVTLCEAR